MRTILFSKMLKDRGVTELIQLAHDWGLGGYDLCVRPGYAVNPENAATALPAAVARCRAEGLDIPMVTGNFDLLGPDHPTAEPILKAMDRADVRLLKLGYFKYDPAGTPYADEVSRVRDTLRSWEPLARDCGVRICYHTHSNRCMGLNGAAMAHLLQDLDPACFGAYLDPAHLVVEGEDFATAVGMVQPYLALIAVKDVLLTRVERHGHGAMERSWVVAGDGCVDWTTVFEVLGSVGYDGPVSVHCEFKVPEETFMGCVAREIAFFNRFVHG